MAEPAPKKGRLTLYENLLSEESLAQMRAKDAEKQAAQQAKRAKDASLMFKPTTIGGNKKPQQKPAKKPNFSAMHKVSSSTTSTNSAAQPAEPSSDAAAGTTQLGPKLTQTRGYEQWLANDDEMDWVYDRQQQEREQRKAKRKNKKNKNKYEEKVRSWDDIYDPTVPVPIAEFARSDFKFDLEEEWKQRLYEASRREKIRQGKDMKSDDTTMGDAPRPRMGRQFAPPGRMSFAPPPSLNARSRSRQDSDDPYSGASSPQRDLSSTREASEPKATYAPPPPAADINMAETADEAYARRMAMATKPVVPSGVSTTSNLPPAGPAVSTFPPSASPPVSTGPALSAADAEKKAKVAAQIAAMKAKFSKPANAATPVVSTAQPASAGLTATQTQVPQSFVPHPPPPPPGATDAQSAAPPKLDAALLAAPSASPAQQDLGGTISSGPTYNPQYLAQKQQQSALAGQAQGVHPQQESEERTNRPGQDGFAERLMMKLGWEKGQGLGASGDGITTALQMQAQKRKKKPDAQGGGFATPAAMGKIVGGKKAKPKPGDAPGDGPGSELDGMSPVVKLSGMLKNMDVDHEIAENNLMQEIGDEMGEQYGKVERLFIWRSKDGGNEEVFVKFTSPLSAVRCLKGMDGTEFADNKVEACYWDAEMFEKGEYALP